MTRRSVAALAVCVLTAPVARCAAPANPPKPAANAATPARSSETADHSGPAARSGAAADICALLPAAEVAEVTQLPIDRVQPKPDGCEWYASAAAQQRQSAATARDTFKQLSAREPKSDADSVKSVEALFNGLRGAATPAQPVFAITVHRGDADQAEALFKGTVTMNGGHVEPIADLGDRAFAGPMGAFYYARRGTTAVLFNGIGSREQTIALAKRIVPRIQ